MSNSISRKTIVLTIPWVTKYLSMLDYVTLRLPFFSDVFNMLFDIHRRCSINGDLAYFGNIESCLLVKLSLGWLFELPHFPDGLYFGYCSSTEAFKKTRRQDMESDICLDQLRMVDQHVLYTCCPYLKEIKKLLMLNSSHNENTTVKHITPVTAVQSPTRVAKKRLEVRYLLNFYRYLLFHFTCGLICEFWPSSLRSKFTLSIFTKEDSLVSKLFNDVHFELYIYICSNVCLQSILKVPQTFSLKINLPHVSPKNEIAIVSRILALHF